MPVKPKTPTRDVQQENSAEYLPESREAPLLYDEEYIKNRINASAKALSALSKKNQKHYKLYKRTAIIIGASIPLFVTITATEAMGDYPILNYSLLALSALGGTVLALMNNILTAGDYYENWKSYRKSSETLLREKYLYLTEMAPYDGKDAFPRLVEKIEDLLDGEDENMEGDQNQPHENE